MGAIEQFHLLYIEFCRGPGKALAVVSYRVRYLVKTKTEAKFGLNTLVFDIEKAALPFS